MNWIDYAIIAIVALGAISGLRKGLIRQFVGVAGFGVGFAIASQYSGALAKYFGLLPDQNWAKIVSFVLIMAAAMGVAAIIGQGLHGIMDMTLFGCFDRWLGAAGGAFLYVLIIEVALILLKNYPVFGTEMFNSTLVQRLLSFAPALLKLLPPEFDAVRQSL